MEKVEEESIQILPDLCLGEVKFYDEHKNFFGVIHQIASASDSCPESVKFYDTDSVSNSFPDGCLVLFRLKRTSDKAKAHEVVQLKEASYSKLLAALQELLSHKSQCIPRLLGAPQFKAGAIISTSLRKQLLTTLQEGVVDKSVSERDINQAWQGLERLRAENEDFLVFLQNLMQRRQPTLRGIVAALHKRKLHIEGDLQNQIRESLLLEIERDRYIKPSELQGIMSSLKWLGAGKGEIMRVTAGSIISQLGYELGSLIKTRGDEGDLLLEVFILTHLESVSSYRSQQNGRDIYDIGIILKQSDFSSDKQALLATLEAHVLADRTRYSSSVIRALYSLTGNPSALESVVVKTTSDFERLCREIPNASGGLITIGVKAHIKSVALRLLGESSYPSPGLKDLGKIISACQQVEVGLTVEEVSIIANAESKWSVDTFIEYIRFLESSQAEELLAEFIRERFQSKDFRDKQYSLLKILIELQHIPLIAKLCLQAWPCEPGYSQHNLCDEVLSKDLNLFQYVDDKLLAAITVETNYELLQLSIEQRSIRIVQALLANAVFDKQESLHEFADWCQQNKSSVEYCVDILSETNAFQVPGRAKDNMGYMCLFAWYHIESATIKRLVDNCDDIRREYLIKYLLYRVYQRGKGAGMPHIKGIEVLRTITEGIKTTALSLNLICFFIKRAPQSGDNLLGLLNSFIYKEIEQEKAGDYSSFKNAFLIKKLSRKCSGRKLQSDSTFREWKQGSVSRVYIDRSRYRVTEHLGIFCEGRPWKSLTAYDSEQNRSTTVHIHYCRGCACYEPNMDPQLRGHFSDWTISEVLAVLGYSIDRLVISTIAGWANRMNEILDHLQCRTCKSVLRPKAMDFDTLGYYAVPIFYCLNNSCADYRQEIRFTHCIKCHGLIDSRDCKPCSNGWLICPDSSCKGCCPTHSGKSYTPVKVQRNEMPDF
ncbi:hypothetical protein [Hymenobacter mucosus]|nr:hypothetical protein [Hymenobacter mucosus]